MPSLPSAVSGNPSSRTAPASLHGFLCCLCLKRSSGLNCGTLDPSGFTLSDSRTLVLNHEAPCKIHNIFFTELTINNKMYKVILELGLTESASILDCALFNHFCCLIYFHYIIVEYIMEIY